MAAQRKQWAADEIERAREYLLRKLGSTGMVDFTFGDVDVSEHVALLSGELDSDALNTWVDEYLTTKGRTKMLTALRVAKNAEKAKKTKAVPAPTTAVVGKPDSALALRRQLYQMMVDEEFGATRFNITVADCEEISNKVKNPDERNTMIHGRNERRWHFWFADRRPDSGQVYVSTWDAWDSLKRQDSVKWPCGFFKCAGLCIALDTTTEEAWLSSLIHGSYKEPEYEYSNPEDVGALNMLLTAWIEEILTDSERVREIVLKKRVLK